MGHAMYVTSSGLLTADTAVYAREALLFAVTLIPAAADSTIAVYDNATTNTGTVLAEIFVKASTASQTIVFNQPVHADFGLFGDITGASAGYILHYCPL